ncbi:MAG: TolC family protein [bacterium]|nr:TolC family protein [bacterium]
MKRNGKMLLGLLVFLAGFGAGAADVPAGQVTLDYCLQKATQDNPLVLKEQEKLAAVKTYLQEARNSRFLPELKLRLLTGPVTDAEGDVLTPTNKITADELSFKTIGPFFQAELTALQPLYTFGAISSAIKAAGQGVKAEENKVELARADLSNNLIDLYLAYQLAHEVYDLQKDLLGEIAKIDQKIQEWLASGSGHVTQTDRLRLKVFTALLEKETLTSKKGLEQSREVFFELCGVNPAESEIPIAPLDGEILSLPDLQKYLDAAQADRPELKALEAAALAKKAQLGVVESKYYPQIFLAGRFRYGYAPGRTPQTNPFVDDEFNYLDGGVVLGLEQKFGFHLTKQSVNRARAEYRELEYGQAALKSGIKIEVEKNYRSVQEAIARVQKTEEGLKAGRAWMFAARENYFLGVGDVKEVIDSFGAYLAVKWQSLEAIFDSQKCLNDLKISAGEKPWSKDK